MVWARNPFQTCRTDTLSMLCLNTKNMSIFKISHCLRKFVYFSMALIPIYRTNHHIAAYHLIIDQDDTRILEISYKRQEKQISFDMILYSDNYRPTLCY